MGRGFEKAALRRSEQGSNYTVWFGLCAGKPPVPLPADSRTYSAKPFTP